jgi:hypothetical protein
VADTVNEPQAKEVVLKSSFLPNSCQECCEQRSQSNQKAEKQANELNIRLGKKMDVKKNCA